MALLELIFVIRFSCDLKTVHENFGLKDAVVKIYDQSLHGPCAGMGMNFGKKEEVLKVMKKRSYHVTSVRRVV